MYGYLKYEQNLNCLNFNTKYKLKIIEQLHSKI